MPRRKRRTAAAKIAENRLDQNRLMLEMHDAGRTSGEIAAELQAIWWRSIRVSWNGRDVTAKVAQWLARRGRIPHEAWDEADLEDMERTRAAWLAAARERLAMEEAVRTLRRQRATLKALVKRLERAWHRITRPQRQEATRARLEAQEAKRAARRAARDSATAAVEGARAARATAVASAKAAAARAFAVEVVRDLNNSRRLSNAAVARELTARGVPRAHGGAWTKGAVTALLRSLD